MVINAALTWTVGTVTMYHKVHSFKESGVSDDFLLQSDVWQLSVAIFSQFVYCVNMTQSANCPYVQKQELCEDANGSCRMQ